VPRNEVQLSVLGSGLSGVEWPVAGSSRTRQGTPAGLPAETAYSRPSPLASTSVAPVWLSPVYVHSWAPVVGSNAVTPWTSSLFRVGTISAGPVTWASWSPGKPAAKAGKRSAVCAAEGLGQDVAGGDRIGQASRAQGVPGQEFAGRGRLWTSVGQLRTPCSGLPEPVRHLVSQVSLPQPLPLWSRDERVDCRTAQRDSVAVERLPTGRPRARKRLAGAAGPPGPRHRRYCRPEQLPRPSFACGDRGRSSGIGDSSPHA
jgi:hypothetical protein